jgi:tetratricopeptide (TPR) repeat protein
MATHGMDAMFGEYRAEFPTIYSLEMRDWKAASALQPVAGAMPQAQTLTYWARTIAAGHLHQPQQARESLAKFESLLDEVRKGKHAYMADSTFAQIEHGEMLAWTAFAEGQEPEALNQMRTAADLQDKVGQGEVDIPAREMLADMLLEFRHPQQALAEYAVALQMSPNRLNDLYHAGLAAEQAGDKAQAAHYYAALMKSTNNGSQSARPEFVHVREFVSSSQVASNSTH